MSGIARQHGRLCARARGVERIPEGQHYDVPDLVRALLEANEPVGALQYDGFWLDIGHPDDYAEALRIEEEVGDEMLIGREP